MGVGKIARIRYAGLGMLHKIQQEYVTLHDIEWLTVQLPSSEEHQVMAALLQWQR